MFRCIKTFSGPYIKLINKKSNFIKQGTKSIAKIEVSLLQKLC